MSELTTQNDNQELSGFALSRRQAQAWSMSNIIPKNYAGNMPNCLVAIEMANRLNASPMLVMQNLYVVHGNPAWSAKFLIASFNQCGRFSAIRYAWEGEKGNDNYGCRAWASEKSTGETIEGPLITIATAKKEGWFSKTGSKWQTIPDLMLMYRSAAWLVNTHAPEISMGLNTTDEMEDVYSSTARPPQSSAAQRVSELIVLKTPNEPSYPVAGGAVEIDYSQSLYANSPANESKTLENVA